MAAYPIVHLEISAKDPAAADKFYSSVFGWKIEVDQQYNYHQFQAEGGPGGAFVELGELYKAGDVVPYVGVDDVDAALSKVVKAGGKIVKPKAEIPGFGWWALFADPNGNRIGLFAELAHHG